jgi:hypothetical protein
MAKVTIKNLFKVKNSIQKEIRLAIFQTIREEKITEQIADVLKETNRDGIDPKTGLEHRALEPSTVNRRSKLSQVNSTHPKYSAGKSNLTFSGKLVDSIKAFSRPAKSLIEIKVTGTHDQYKGLVKKKLGKRIRNEDIQKYLADQDRNLLGLSQEVSDKIIKIIKEKLVSILKRNK